MCGFVISNINFDINILKNSLNHRGPDSTEIFQNNRIKMIFNRLSIIDLKNRSNQPFRKNNFIMVYNGEIYNYLEIKQKLKKIGCYFKTESDTEVLINAYIKWGSKCLNYLEGMFSFCIYDIKTNEIFAARDRFGIKPLFIYKNNNKFILSSEKKAIFDLNVPKEINKSQISNYIAYGVYQHKEQTFYKHIKNISPGTYLRIKDSYFKNKNWWNFSNKKIKIDYNDAKKELEKKLQKSINLCLRSDKSISVALSGGLDSSSLAYFINNSHSKGLVNNNLVHWTCNGNYDESPYARKIAKNINKKLNVSYFLETDFFKYTKKAIKSVEEPFGGLNNISAMKMYERLKKNKIRVLIDGNGADEILGGYSHHINAHNNDNLDYTYQPVQGLKINYFKNILSVNYLKELEKFTLKKKFNNPLKDSMYNDLTGTKLRRTLLQQDHLAMKNSIEVRFPFLNNELVDFSYSLPNEYLVKGQLGKYILRKIVNFSSSMNKKRPIQTPQTIWMKKFIIKELINEINNNNKINDFKIFNRKKLLEKLNSWNKNNYRNSVFPWQILMIINFLKFNF
jgi:asparagine synthase (glutamine-hydrolysing)